MTRTTRTSSRPLRTARTATLTKAQQESNRQLHALVREIRGIRRLEREGRWQSAARATADLRARAARLGLADEVEALLPGVDGPRLHSASRSLRRWW